VATRIFAGKVLISFSSPAFFLLSPCRTPVRRYYKYLPEGINKQRPTQPILPKRG
jgi:hypothetical protein